MNLPGRIARDSSAGRHAANDVASETDQGAIIHVNAIHDAGTAADIAIPSDGGAAGDRHVRPDETPVPNDRIVMNHGVRQDAYMTADDRVARNHYASHDQYILSNDR